MSVRGMEAVRYSGAGLFFLGAVLLALLAGMTIFGYLRSAVPSTEVLTISRDLPPGAIISESDLTVQKVPKGVLPAGTIVSAKDAVGRRIRFGLAGGDYLRTQHLVPDGNSDVAAKVSEMGIEYRAVMLPGDLVPASTRLIPGDRLELTAVLPVQDQKTNTNVAVPLGVATVLDAKAALGQSDKTVVLVAMPAAEVSKLALAMRSGSLMVAVHGTGELSPSASPIRLDALTAPVVQSSPVTATPNK